MAEGVVGGGVAAPPGAHKLHEPAPLATRIVFLILLVAGVGYCGYSVHDDIEHVGEALDLGVFGLLGLALLIALGFEFVNGFHDTANAVATVIYTHSMQPVVAVVWSGCLELPRRAGLHRRGGLSHHHPAAGGADPAGRQPAPAMP